MANIELKYFCDINFDDPFFDSLKDDYIGFERWFINKVIGREKAFTLYEGNILMAFLYLKVEDEIDMAISPRFEEKIRLKVGTFKVDAHGTKLGERFIKRIFDVALSKSIDEIYVTIFSKHHGLIDLLKTFGFYEHGTKSSTSGNELVLVKKFSNLRNNILLDYPVVKIHDKNIYGLSIQPVFHTKLFSDSILNNENVDILKDVSHSNSIHKVYICAMSDVQRFNKGDIILIYRTTDHNGPARFRSVITSICLLEDFKNINDFETVEEFIEYCNPHSIFTEDELRNFFKTKKYPFILKMTYNVALKKRVTNGQLIDIIGLSPTIYWGVFDVTLEQFKNIIQLGNIDDVIIN